ncbi:MAG: peptide chain release factor-like protein [Planctomycetota bacterium]
MPPTPVHPAMMAIDELRKDCRSERLRRSGPGGQHRNKVETAAVVTHLPSGVRAEANERRSQAQNAAVAMQRLRLRLAIELRTTPGATPSELWRRRSAGGSLRVNPQHAEYPALLAEALDRLAANGWDDRQAAEELGVSRTALVRLLKGEPAAIEQLNACRAARGLRPLR